MRRSITVRIAGHRVALKSDADEEYVQSLAGFVDHKIQELQRKSRQVGIDQAALLAALQITDELFREKRGRAELRRRVKAQAQRVLDAVAANRPVGESSS